jgi:hypothetical protein
VSVLSGAGVGGALVRRGAARRARRGVQGGRLSACQPRRGLLWRTLARPHARTHTSHTHTRTRTHMLYTGTHTRAHTRTHTCTHTHT